MSATELKTEKTGYDSDGLDVVVIYHKGCPDGFCAAWLLRKIFPKAEFLPMSPGQSPHLGQMADKYVIVADLSFSPEVTYQVIDVSKSFLCLDHHRTAAEKLEGIPGCFFNESKSGARMVWDWFSQRLSQVFSPYDRSPRPGDVFVSKSHWLVDYTEDRDLWRWRLPRSRQVNAALGCFDLDFDVWDKLRVVLTKDEVILKSHNQSCDGQTIFDYHNKKATEAAKRAVLVEVFIDDDTKIIVPAVNVINHDHTSEVGHILAATNDSRVGITYYHDGEGFRFSVRSVGDGDAGRIAEFYGGGGHRHAAGFYSESFLRVVDEYGYPDFGSEKPSPSIIAETDKLGGDDDHPGTPFYYLNGPLEGEVILGDFRKTSHKIGDGTAVEYRKNRFGSEGSIAGLKYCIKVDVAYVGDCPNLPGEVLEHAELQFISAPIGNGNNFDPATTNLHDAIEDVAERQDQIDWKILESARAGDRGPDQQRIAEEVIRFGALLLRKNHDYGCGVWKSPVLVPACDPKTAILVRMSDKINRIAALSESEAEVAESFNDTLRDLGAYCLLELARPGERKAK